MTALILHGPSSTDSSTAFVDSFDAMTGVRSTMLHCHFPAYYGTNSDGSDRWLNVNITLADSLWKRGQIALYTLGTWNLGTKVAWKPADVIAGKYDAYLTTQAKALAKWAHPIILRLDHEMNGTWSPWFTDGPSFVQLWRYIVALFRQNGATNATWHWCPNQLAAPGANDATAADKLAAYYPGDDVVDYTGFDAYNTGKPWLTFAQTISGGVAGLGDTYGTIAKLAPTKPMILSEFGCTSTGGNKAAWITDALAVIPTQYPLVRAVSYYQMNDDALASSDGTAAAYAGALTTGPYAKLGSYPMPPDHQVLRPLTVAATWGDAVADLAAAQSSVQSLTGQVQTLTTQVQTDQQTQASLSAQVQSAQAQQAQLSSQLAQQQQANATLTSQASGLQSQLDTETQSASNLGSQVQSLQTQLTQAQADRDAARKDAATGRAKLTDLTSWAQQPAA